MLSKAKPIFQASGIPSLVASLVSVGTLIGGFITVDTRYAHADDVTQLIQQNKAQQATIQSQLLQYKKQQLEDQIFTIQLKKQFGKADKVDDAMLTRYQQQLNDLQTQKIAP
jgi:hypothetical protein